ncbi:MAG: YdeI/OmpD-associated family protein, partial [Microvirga sp.]
MAAKHHRSSSELWVQIFKAGSGRSSVTWADCAVEAIRFGWIDGQKLPLDEQSYLQRLTPRKPKSNWSAK